MPEEILLDRNLYRTIKNMSRTELNSFIHNIYSTGKEDALAEIEVKNIDIEKIRSEISEINGIGEVRLNKIMNIISKNIWQWLFNVLYWNYKF